MTATWLFWSASHDGQYWWFCSCPRPGGELLLCGYAAHVNHAYAYANGWRQYARHMGYL
jgi:hypothetical protein